MRAYRCHAACVALFLAGYLLLGGVFRFTRPSGEVFPVSSWTLFLHVPNRVVEYGVEILALEGRALDVPRAFHDARGLPGSGRVDADRVVQRMGRAHEAGDEARLAELRRLFEGRWLEGEHAPVRYRLVRRVYAPVERWRSGDFLELQTLRELDFAGGRS